MSLDFEYRAPEWDHDQAPDLAPDGTPVAVLLHGRGSDRHDLPNLHRHLPAGTALIAPEAPHPGAPWQYGPGWAWYRYVAEDRVVADTLAESLTQLDDFMDALPEALGFTPGPIVLGGFSQGGTTSLAWALTRPGRVQGVAVFSGFLADAPGMLDPADLSPDTVAATAPIFWGHGTRDPAIPYALGEKGRARLSELGADLTTWNGPIGHQISGDELAALRDWMTDQGLVSG